VSSIRRRLLSPSATALAVGIGVSGLVAIIALLIATWSLKVSVDQAADRAADRAGRESTQQSLCEFYDFNKSGPPATTARGKDLIVRADAAYKRLGCG
jgi:hypothetical protein